MTALDIAIELSDLYEAVGAEGSVVATLIDTEILPYIRDLAEADGIGLGKRFSQIINQVRDAVGDSGSDTIRNLKEMMKEALKDYVKKTSDALTARDIFHHAIMAGADTMLTVIASIMLANALCRHSPKEAQKMVRQVAGRLTGEQVAENTSGAAVGAGAIATVALPLGRKKKRRKDSIFAEGDVVPFGRPEPVQNPTFDQNADMTNVSVHPGRAKTRGEFFVILYVPGEGERELELNMGEILKFAYWYRITKPDPSASMWYQPGSDPVGDVPTMHILHATDHSRLSPVEISRVTHQIQQALVGWMREDLSWDDLIGNSTMIEVLKEIAESGCNRKVDGVLVDPTTAELVVAAHQALSPKKRQHFQQKSLPEMIEIAQRLVAAGFLSVVMEEG